MSLTIADVVEGFDDYQDRVATTARYPEAGTGSAMALAYVGLVLAAGKVQGKIRKILRDDDGVLSMEERAEIAAELGDVLWYVARACAEISVPMQVVASLNIAKLADRAERGVLGGSGDNR